DDAALLPADVRVPARRADGRDRQVARRAASEDARRAHREAYGRPRGHEEHGGCDGFHAYSSDRAEARLEHRIRNLTAMVFMCRAHAIIVRGPIAGSAAGRIAAEDV